MNFNDDFGSDSESSDVENQKEGKGVEGTPEFLPSFVLFAIDTSSSMFDKNEDCTFIQAISAFYSIADSLITSTSFKHRFAVVLASTDVIQPEIISFKSSLADAINVLTKMGSSSDPKDYKRGVDFDLADFLLNCKKKLLEANVNAFQRTIVFVTNDDNPTDNDAKQILKITQVTNSFGDYKIALKVVTMNPTFNCSSLYQDLKAEVNRVDDVTEMISTLSAYIQPKVYKLNAKLFLFRGHFDRYVFSHLFTKILAYHL